MGKLSLLFFIVFVSCGKAPDRPRWHHENTLNIETESPSLSPYRDLENKSFPAIKCVAEKDYQVLDQFEWIVPTKPELIKILKYRLKNAEQTFAIKIPEQSLSEGQIEILFRKAHKRDFRDNTLAQMSNYQSEVLYEGVPTEIYSSDETIFCTFNNP